MKATVFALLFLCISFSASSQAFAVPRGYTGYESSDGLSLGGFKKLSDYTYDNIKKFYGERKGLAEELARQRAERMAYRKSKGWETYEFKPSRKTMKVVNKAKLTGRGILSDLTIATGMSLVNGLKEGASVQDSFKQTIDTMTTPAFLIGQVMGGAVGATLGSLIPVPAVSGVLGRALKSVPVIGGAMLVGTFASTAISLLRDGNLTLSNLFNSVDLVGMAGQVAGVSLGASLGSVLIPIPGIGSIVGAIVGGLVIDKILARFRSKTRDSDLASSATTTVPENISVGSSNALSLATRPDRVSLDEAKEEADKAYSTYLQVLSTPEASAAFNRYVHARNAYMALRTALAAN